MVLSQCEAWHRCPPPCQGSLGGRECLVLSLGVARFPPPRHPGGTAEAHPDDLAWQSHTEPWPCGPGTAAKCLPVTATGVFCDNQRRGCSQAGPLDSGARADPQTPAQTEVPRPPPAGSAPAWRPPSPLPGSRTPSAPRQGQGRQEAMDSKGQPGPERAWLRTASRSDSRRHHPAGHSGHSVSQTGPERQCHAPLQPFLTVGSLGRWGQ